MSDRELRQERKEEFMLEQLVECENRLLEEQRRFNELLLAWRSGDLGDDLTRMKIDQMQREVDALGRQLTALRTSDRGTGRP